MSSDQVNESVYGGVLMVDVKMSHKLLSFQIFFSLITSQLPLLPKGWENGQPEAAIFANIFKIFNTSDQADKYVYGGVLDSMPKYLRTC